jgi:hypothetical protein
MIKASVSVILGGDGIFKNQIAPFVSLVIHIIHIVRLVCHASEVAVAHAMVKM